jgi:type II secretory pathway component PulF
MTSEKSFAYRGKGPDGADVAEIVRAPDRKTALLSLQQQGVTILSLEERSQDGHARSRGTRERSDDRLLVLHQLAVLSRSGIPILEAVESIAAALQGRPVASRLTLAAAALRRGDAIAPSMRTVFPQFPEHVHALVRVGERNGNLADVLEEAVRQLRFQAALKRDVLNALIYPLFLLSAAFLAVAFLFLVVVPRFAAMLGPARADLTGLSAAVLDIGVFVHAYPAPVLGGVGIVLGMCAWLALAPDGQRLALKTLSRWPVIGDRIAAAQRADWARIMAFAVSSGVGILEAATLAFNAAPEGRFRDDLTGSIRALRRGEPIAEAFGASGALDAIDMSLLRTGQRSGQLGAMFTLVADRHEERVRTELKRGMALLEQAAIALVALAIGIVVIGLVGAMTSMYESIG